MKHGPACRTTRTLSNRRTWVSGIVWVLCSLVVLFGCQEAKPAEENSASGAGTCSLDLAADASDQVRIDALLKAEGAYVVSQDIDALMRLWYESGTVTDAKNTPDNAEDDQTWDGKDAIRHRYVRTVFPGAPSTAQPADLEITIDGDTATVLATTQIGQEVSPAGDRWDLVRVDDCWLLQHLSYNLEATP